MSVRNVAQCIKLNTKEKMAVKVLRKEECGSRELLMHQELRKLDLDKNNLVRMIEHFQYMGHTCLALEMLDISVFDYMKTIRQLRFSEIQMITQQLLVALNALKRIGIVHVDIKPDNIMLVDHKLQPFKVKLIDFSMARSLYMLQGCRGRKIQTLYNRSPEVILGLELNEAMDMWSLGCLLAFMYLGFSLFPRCEHNIVSMSVKIQGLPMIAYWILDFLPTSSSERTQTPLVLHGGRLHTWNLITQ